MEMHMSSVTRDRLLKERAIQRRRDNPDYMKHLGYFVRGALMEYYKNTGMGSDIWSEGFEHYYRDTMNKVIGYLAGTQVLDGSCSDFQCGIAHEAEKAF